MKETLGFLVALLLSIDQMTPFRQLIQQLRGFFVAPLLLLALVIAGAARFTIF